MQHLLKITFIRNHLYSKAMAQFTVEQRDKNILLRNDDVPEKLHNLRTLLIDASLVMQGRDAVRRVAAPLAVADATRIKHQPAWIMLAMAVSLGCEGYAPLSNFVRELNFARDRMLRQYPQVDAIPYDDARQMDTTIHREAGGLRAYAKGATDAVLAKCTHVLDGKERLLTAEDRERALEAAASMEAVGLHTLAFATRKLREAGEFEEGMVFLGVVGTGDLPVEDAPWSMEAMREAGVRPVLVAQGGLTGGSVCASGSLRPEAGMMDASEVDALDDAALVEAVRHADAYLHIDWKRRERLAKAMREDGLAATLTPDLETHGMVMAFEGGLTADVVFRKQGLGALVRMLGECRALCDTFNPDKLAAASAPVAEDKEAEAAASPVEGAASPVADALDTNETEAQVEAEAAEAPEEAPVAEADDAVDEAVADAAAPEAGEPEEAAPTDGDAPADDAAGEDDAEKAGPEA